MRSSFTRGRTPLVIWTTVLLLALATTIWQAGRSDWLHSNIFELLPASDYDPLTETAMRRVDAELSSRLLFFIGHVDTQQARSAADRFAEELLRQPLLESVTVRASDSEISSLVAFLYPYRSFLMSDAQIGRIENSPEAIEADAVARFHSPFDMTSALDTDPFGLFATSIADLRPAGSGLRLDGGYLIGQQDGRDYVFIMAELSAPSLSIAEQERLITDINSALDRTLPQDAGFDVLRTGFSFYAHHATQSAKGEVSTIGVGSLIGLLLLVIATFRTVSPLSLIVVSILAGCTVALAVTVSVFGFVHLFTLVFGASLIGVSVDYGFHYIADDAFGDEDWTPSQGVRNIFPGITLGLVTSVLAYLALTVAPFPGLRQLALFSSAGLIAAYLTLLCLCRLWRRRVGVRQASAILRFARFYLGIWRGASARSQVLLIAAIVVAITVLWRGIDIDDDVRVLQSQPQDLIDQEAAIQSLLGTAQAGTFLLVSADDEEQLLQREETLRPMLDELIRAGELDGYQATSRYVPSAARQQRSRAAWQKLIENRLPSFLSTLGVEETVAAQIQAGLTEEPPSLDIDDWLDHSASEPFRSLWLTGPDAKRGSIILLFGVDSIERIDMLLGNAGDVEIVNKGAELSALFGQYRARVASLLLLAYAVILVGLAIRYGIVRSALLVTPPVLAGLLALVLIALGGEALNLFSFLALILVLGIGIDFTLFIAEARHDLEATMFAITLSALTTMLSFGLLSLSSTYAVHSFGIAVLLGIAFAYLLSPLAIGARSRPPAT